MEITTGVINYTNKIETNVNVNKVSEVVTKDEIKEIKKHDKKHTLFPLEQNEADRKVLNNFYQENISIDELALHINESLEKLHVWYIEDGLIDAENSIDGTTKYLQKQFKRWKIFSVQSANHANDIEGIEVAKKNGFRHGEENMDYAYYNAEYYYKWEEVVQVINECIEEKAKELGIKNLDKHGDWEENISFNRSWSTGIKRYAQMINPEAIPPRDFVFFYREEYSTQYINKGSIYQSSMLICNRRMIVNGLDVKVSDKSELSDEKREKLYKLVDAREFFEDNYRKDGMKVAGPGFLANFVIRYQQFDGINRIETKNFTFNNIEYYHSNETDKEDSMEGKFKYEFLKRRMQRNGGLMQKLRKTE